jgi:hypothetical protein
MYIKENKKYLWKGECNKKMNTLTMSIDAVDSIKNNDGSLDLLKVKSVELTRNFIQFIQEQLLKKAISLDNKLAELEYTLITSILESNENTFDYLQKLETSIDNILEKTNGETPSDGIVIENLDLVEEYLQSTLKLMDEASNILSTRRFNHTESKTITSLTNSTNRNINIVLRLLDNTEVLNRLSVYKSLEKKTQPGKKIWFFIVFAFINFLPSMLGIRMIFDIPSIIFVFIGLYSLIGSALIFFHYNRNKKEYNKLRNALMRSYDC